MEKLGDVEVRFRLFKEYYTRALKRRDADSRQEVF